LEANAKCGAEVLVVDNRELGCSIHRLTTKHSIMYLSIHQSHRLFYPRRQKAWLPCPHNHIWYLDTPAREHRTTIELFNSSLREEKPWRDHIAVEPSIFEMDNGGKSRLEAERV
jgi:hypothetical protein